MNHSSRAWAALSILAIVSFGGLGHAHARPAGIVLLNQREQALDTSGKVGTREVDSAGVKVAEPVPMGTLTEKSAPTIPRRPLRKSGALDRATLDADINKNFKDLELCRYKVAAAAGVVIPRITAGKISLHWTILPNGRTRDTVVIEDSQTDLAVMKCIRRRMNSWTFGRPKGGPVPVDYEYTFSALSEQIAK